MQVLFANVRETEFRCEVWLRLSLGEFGTLLWIDIWKHRSTVCFEFIFYYEIIDECYDWLEEKKENGRVFSKLEINTT